MKRLGVLLAALVALVCIFASACESSNGFVGTFVKEGSNATYTMTLNSDGSFKFVRKYKQSSGLEGDPVDNANNNVRQGRYTVDSEKGIAIFSYSYYDVASERNVSCSAKGELVKQDGKIMLKMSGDEFNGVYTKK